MNEAVAHSLPKIIPQLTCGKDVEAVKNLEVSYIFWLKHLELMKSTEHPVQSEWRLGAALENTVS